MNIEKTMRYIQNNFNRRQQRMLLGYINGDFFEKDLNKLLFIQSTMGEPLSRDFATECTLMSYIEDNDTFK